MLHLHVCEPRVWTCTGGPPCLQYVAKNKDFSQHLAHLYLGFSVCYFANFYSRNMFPFPSLLSQRSAAGWLEHAMLVDTKTNKT